MPRHKCVCRGASPDARICRPCERSPEIIQRAVPNDCEMPGDFWLATAKQHIRGESLKSDWRQRIIAVAEMLHHSRARTRGTTMPGLTQLSTLLSCSLRTVRRAISWLKSKQLLTTLARGRSKWTDSGQNDREVFVLIRPVEKSVRPVVNPSSTSQTPAARAQHFIRKAAGAAGIYRPMTRTESEVHIWDGRTVPNGHKEELLATSEIVRRLPHVFRNEDIKKLWRVVAPFFRAGLRVQEIINRLDHRPDGTPWPHSGADGVKHPAAWAARRLDPWKS